MAPRKTTVDTAPPVQEATPAVQAVPSPAPVKRRGRGPSTNLAAVVVGEIEAEQDDNPFARGAYLVPEDNIVLLAFRSTYKAQKAARVYTDEGSSSEDVVKLLRRIASQEGQGVRVQAKEVADRETGKARPAVIFQATDRRTRKPRTD